MVDTTAGILRAAAGTWAETRLVATSVATGRARLSASDVATRSQSLFDRCSRIGLPQARHVPDAATDLDFLTTQVIDWDSAEIAQLDSFVSALRQVLDGIEMNLPQVVYLVKTTGREEAAPAFRLHADTIVLPANMVASLRVPPPGGDDLHPARTTRFFAGVLTHEVFHIRSKNTPAVRAGLCSELGFRERAAPLDLPDDLAPCGLPCSALKRTNPDAPCPSVSTDLVPPDGRAAVPMVPVLVSRSPCEDSDFFAALDWVFLELDDATTGWRRGADGQLRLHPADALMPQYLRQVGRNLTEEMFHPDETLAQSLVMSDGPACMLTP
jgi:hypothetical protein